MTVPTPPTIRSSRWRPFCRTCGPAVCTSAKNVLPELHAFHGYIDGLARNLHAKGPTEGTMGHRTTNFQCAIASVHLYPFVVVIERRDDALDHLIDEEHGTEWQPFGHKHLGL